jgi:hypothetical protein
MPEQLKLLAKVIALGLSPIAISILIATQFNSDETQILIVFVGGIVSAAVVFWIYWFWVEPEPGDEDPADD